LLFPNPLMLGDQRSFLASATSTTRFGNVERHRLSRVAPKDSFGAAQPQEPSPPLRPQCNKTPADFVGPDRIYLGHPPRCLILLLSFSESTSNEMKVVDMTNAWDFAMNSWCPQRTSGL